MKLLTPELLDAGPFNLIPVCETLIELQNLIERYNPKQERAIAASWANLQTWFWKHPQKVGFN